MKRLGFILFAATVLSTSHMTVAHAEKYEASYTISYAGLPVARSSFTTTMSGKQYAISGSLKSAGFGALFSSASGSAKTAGNLGATAAVPTLYNVNYKYDDKVGMTSIAFAGGKATKIVNDPALKVRKDKVPVQPNDLIDVADPLSVGLIVADNKNGVCKRTLQFFDGEMRGNLVLSYKSTRPFSTDGFKGEQIVCEAKFVPVSGYRKNHKSIKYLTQGKLIEIGFAQLHGQNVYAPVSGRVKTKIGTVSVRATKLKTIGG